MLSVFIQSVPYVIALVIPYLMLTGGMTPQFYFPFFGVPILFLSYFSIPMTAAGMFIFAILVGTVGLIFSIGNLATGGPFIFLLQMGWLWYIFWKAQKMIEAKDLEVQKVQEKIENLEIGVQDLEQKRKELEELLHGLKEKIYRYTQLRSFTDDLSSYLQIEEIKRQTKDSIRRFFSRETGLEISLNLFPLPSSPAKGDEIGEWIVKHRIPFLVGDMSQDPRLTSSHSGKKGSFIAAPLERENLIMGTLNLESPKLKRWREEDLRFFSDISNIVSLVTTNALFYEKIESLAVRDSLTGLFVRYRFDERLEEEFFRSKINKSELSLIIFDIDHFKRVNDSWGHLVGDKILHNVAEIIVTQTRTTDFCSRYGGEEIAVLMPFTSKENAYLIADRIRLKVMATPMGKEKIYVTISGGVSSRTSDMDHSNILIETADRALYKAKDLGRNKVNLQ
ncbi:MAG: diguanylate cyclase [Elusimicrobia bacterium]|nr:diguanylate cyclase [Elusimicrobiota bacterium]